MHRTFRPIFHAIAGRRLLQSITRAKRSISISVLVSLLVWVAIVLSARVHATPALAVGALQTEPDQDPCASPTMQVRNAAVNVRQGPDPNYRILLVLQAGETLPIVGRHHGFRWWAVALPGGSTGWVWESGVNVFGDIASVPLLPAPPLNGAVPDTIDEWTPAVAAPCLATPEAEVQADSGATPPEILAPEPDDAGVPSRDSWSLPVNLSRSGGTGNPILVADETDTLHVLWEDSYNGYTYTQLGPEGWAAPITVTVPFSETNPYLFADGSGQIQALWIGESGSLQHSKVSIPDITNPLAWQPPVELAGAATSMAATVDGDGKIHLVYLLAEETAAEPAGIYYRRSADGGTAWSPAELLYASPYLRGINVAESNVQIAATSDAGETNIYVAWDNRPRKRLFFIHGRDGGAEWHSPVELAGPDSTSSIIIPFNVRLSARDNRILVTWQYGQPGTQCQRKSQSSADYGQSWSEPVILADLNPGFASCASDQQLYANDTLFYLLATIENQAYLQAWDGKEWSEPQRQITISSFNDPETLNTVVLGCHQAALLDGSVLAVLACDTSGAFVTGDIWFTSRPLGTTETWYPPPTEWGTPAVVTPGLAGEETLNLMGDNGGTIHAVWVAQNPEQETNAIYYSRQDGDRWLAAVTLSSAFGAANMPAGPLTVAMSPDDRLFAVWQNGDGALLLSQAAAADAAITTEWSPPVSLPIQAARVNGVALAVEESGALDIAYSVPYNEARGVYLLRSEDHGASWSGPVTLLDGEVLNWEIVGAPQLAVSASGSLHIAVRQETLGSSPVVTTEALYYIRCSTAGELCGEPALVAENRPDWTALVTAGPQILHHLWQEQNGDDLLIRHRYSSDDGRSWSDTQLVLRVAAASAGPVDVVSDAAGRLHLFETEPGVLIPWQWEDGIWQQEQALAAEVVSPLRGIVTRNGTVAVLFSREGEGTSEDGVEPGMELVAMSRQIEFEVPPAVPTPLPDVLPMATPAVGLTATPTPTPTVSFAQIPESGSEDGGAVALANANTPVAQIGAGLIPVAFLVAVVLALGARSVWLRRQ